MPAHLIVLANTLEHLERVSVQHVDDQAFTGFKTISEIKLGTFFSIIFDYFLGPPPP